MPMLLIIAAVLYHRGPVVVRCLVDVIKMFLKETKVGTSLEVQ